MEIELRKIDTGLTSDLELDIIDALRGQLSDGMWENSRAMEGYWPYFAVKKIGNKVILLVSKEYKGGRDYVPNKFLDMSDDDIKTWLAKKIKAVIKEEGLEWKRDNTKETDYLSTDWRSSKESATVADCYYVYEVLKGRNVAKHQEYAKKMNISDALKTLDDAKIKYVQAEDEPWESDLDESAISQPLLSEAVLTPEQKEARRARAKSRRDLKKLEKYWFVKRCGKGPYYVRIYMKLGDLGSGWWQEGSSEHPEYRGYPTLAAVKAAYPGMIEELLDGKALRWEGDEGPQNRIRMVLGDTIPNRIRARIDADLAHGKKESIHYPNED